MIAYLRFQAKQKWPLFLLYFIIFFMGGVIQLIDVAALNLSYTLTTLYQMALLVILISAIALPLSFMRPFYEKKSLDFYFSLPISKNHQFLSHFFLSMMIVLFPLWLNTLLCGFLLPSSFFLSVLQASSFLSIVYFIYVSIATLIGMQNHRSSDFLLTTIGYFFLLPFFTVCIESYLNSAIIGYQSSFSHLSEWIAPFASYSSLVSSLFSDSSSFVPLLPLLVWFLIGLLSLGVAYRLFLVFPAEYAQEPNRTWYYYPLLMNSYAILFLLLFLSTYNYDLLYPYYSSSPSYVTLLLGILFIYILYILISFVAYKGIKHFIKSSFLFLMISGGTLAINHFVVITKGFGLGTYIPAPTEIQSIEVQLPSPSYLATYPMTNAFYTIDQASDFEAITNYHHAILALLDQPLDSSMTLYQSFVVNYHLQDGRVISRSYSFPSPSMIDVDILTAFYAIDALYQQNSLLYSDDPIVYSLLTNANSTSNQDFSELRTILQEEATYLRFQELYQGHYYVGSLLLSDPSSTSSKGDDGFAYPLQEEIVITDQMVRTIAYIKEQFSLDQPFTNDASMNCTTCTIKTMKVMLPSDYGIENLNVINPMIASSFGYNVKPMADSSSSPIPAPLLGKTIKPEYFELIKKHSYSYLMSAHPLAIVSIEDEKGLLTFYGIDSTLLEDAYFSE